jgi:hypothetical protein
VEESQLSTAAPNTLRYLQAFEEVLRDRAAYRRYYSTSGKPAAAFYSMFDVGEYTLSAYKVVWNRMGSKLAAAVVGSRDGRPILPQETHAAFAVQGEDEAHYLAALLNSRLAAEALAAMGQVGGKSFATPRAIHRLRLSQFDETNALHRELAAIGRTASTGAATDGLDRAVEAYWGVKSQSD